jgi:hypothetical protein
MHYRIFSSAGGQAGPGAKAPSPMTRTLGHSLAVCCALAVLGLAPALNAKADGIPEPSLVMYGVISDASAGGVRVSYGTLTWVFQPADGSAAITFSAPVTNINDQFSYVLRIPCETQLPGVPGSSGTLKLATSPSSYDRSSVTVQGIVAAFVQPSQTNLTLFSTDRGQIERLDLTVNLSSSGLLPDAWQLQYFGHTGVDPFADPDHDGLNNYQEYRAGTNPLDPNSRFEIVRVRPDPAGAYVEWSSVASHYYTVQRSSALLGGFSDLQTHIPATAPLNTFQDLTGTDGGPYFYRIQVE